MDRQEMIFLMTEIMLGHAGEQLVPNAIGKNAILSVDGIRIE